MAPNWPTIQEVRTVPQVAQSPGFCGGFVVWPIVPERKGKRPLRKKERNAHVRGYIMTARKSRNGESVSARTLARQDACHSLKATERAPMGAHGLQCLSSLLGAPGGLWCVISFSDGLGENRSKPHSFAHFLEAQKASITASPESIKNWRGRVSVKNWREMARVKNWRGKLAIFSPRKCNDQNTLWRGGSLIRMPYQIRDADSWAAVRSGCPIK